MALLPWTQLRRKLLGPDKLFDLTQHKYLAGIYEDDCQEMVLCKAGQVGISEYLVSWLLHSASERQCTGLYVFPTDTHVSDFSAARLGPAIDPDVSQYLADLVMPASGGQRGADRVGLKRVGSRFIYFRGAKVQPDGRAPQLRSVDADVLILDEYDEMDPRAPALARERLGHSFIWKAINESGTCHARLVEIGKV
jgi:phage terminase large subunit GpA-like protein